MTSVQTRLALVALTAIGFALRLAGIDQSLYGDEGYTLGIVDGHGLGDVITAVHDTSITPPLHYVLAWVAVQFGDPDLTVRVPSLIFGTLTIPLIFVLGRRVAGATSGWVAAAIVTLSPFAVFYSVEARAYATMMFLVTLSTLALLRALDGGRRWWWVLYAVCACLTLYCHYSGVFVVAAQAAWAFAAHRERWRLLAAVHAAMALGYVAWIPSYLHQRENDFVDAVGLLYPLTFESAWDYVARLLPGHPFVGLGSLPGTAAAVVLAVCLAVALAAFALRAVRAARPRLQDPLVLVVLLALATPVGMLLWSLAGSSLYAPRNLSASLPALAVVAGALLTSPGARLAVPLTATVLATFAFVSVRSLSDDYSRPAYKQVAEYIDANAGPGDPVVTSEQEALAPVLAKQHTLLTPGFDDGPAYERAKAGRPIFIVRGEFQPGLPRLGGPNGLLVLRGGKQFPGFIDLAVGRYAGEASAAIEDGAIRFSTGAEIPIVDDAARGFVDSAGLADGTLTAGGWATTPSGERPADRVLAFAGDRLVAVGRLRLRPDVAEELGQGALTSGFEVTARLEPRDVGRVAVYAEVDGRATRLEVSEAARRIQGAG